MSKDTSMHKFTNSLINETSPYLLQHAHNPVNWLAWGEEALKKAKSENKLILISIGYSACHWCHVMEKESFEDEAVAKFMNENFICIKVDREERPDVDQVYMNAVQLITGRGGWPLNCFALPDGRPFYGGTYFQKKNWLYLLQNIVNEYRSDPKKLEVYATDLTKNINRVELSPIKDEDIEEKIVLSKTLSEWKTHFDNKDGGPDRSPKFPLPNNYEFLLDYAILTNDEDVLSHVKLTLDKMAHGGIYDQAGGGFARYSTDVMWKVPHFEKMLYDNAQLISLYSKAYRYFKNPFYKEIVEQSAEFIARELTGPNGEFYSALDADSEGEEGKFYVWSEEELAEVKGLDFEFVKVLYRIQKSEKWENHYILQRSEDEAQIMKKFGLNKEAFKSKVRETNILLLEARSERIRPGLDDKSLTSWNALMVTAYLDAYIATENNEYLNAAQKNASFIWDVQFADKKVLLHNYKKGKSTIPAFLEDYAFSIKAFTDMYQVTFEDIWLERAEVFMGICLNSFFNKDENMFFFTSENEKLLIARKMEIQDNVIPSSNSAMARNLNVLGLLKQNNDWIDLSKKMIRRVSENIPSYGSAYSNWAHLLINESIPFYEIAICGSKTNELILNFGKHYHPNSLFLGSKKEGDLPLLEYKYVKGKTLIYVCVDKTCQLPVETVNEAVKQITYN